MDACFLQVQCRLTPFPQWRRLPTWLPIPAMAATRPLSPHTLFLVTLCSQSSYPLGASASGGLPWQRAGHRNGVQPVPCPAWKPLSPMSLPSSCMPHHSRHSHEGCSLLDAGRERTALLGESCQRNATRLGSVAGSVSCVNNS